MEKQKFSAKKRLRSFRFALNGFKILIKEEHNSRIHIIAAICAIIAGFVFKISALEWIATAFAIGLVFTLELVNSSIENLADFISPEKHESIKKIKDLAAGGVLIAAFTALSIGLIIYIPKLFELC